MKKIVLLAVLFVFQNVIGQNTINNYKYVVVPNQYEFQKSENQYQINALTKFLFEKNGFETLYSNEEFPEDLANNPCLALKGKILNKSSLLTTRVQIELLDCNNKVVYKTNVGKTKEKDYTKAYNQAIRNAFQDIEALNYSYQPNTANNTKIIPAKKDTVAISKVTKTTTIVSDKADIKPKEEQKKQISTAKMLPASIVGYYNFDKWGRSEIVKVGEQYIVRGGTESFTFANIYPTSLPNYYIIKWVAYKEPKLVKFTTEGNLEIDADDEKVIYKRIN